MRRSQRRAGAAHHDAGEAPRPGIVELDDADIDIALLEDAVLGEQPFDVVADLEEGIAECVDVGDELWRQVLMHAAGAEIGGVHAAAARALVEHHQLLALLEAPERRGERADIHRLRRDIEEVGEEAADLAIEHADELAALGHVDAEKPLDREREGMLLVHRRDVIEPVEIGHRLQIGLVLDQLLGAAMQQPDMRIDALDHLAVELEHEAQHAVRGRVLRPEIDGEVAVLGVRVQASVSVWSRPSCVHFGMRLSRLWRRRISLNRSQLTMKRSWVPEPISSMPSCALELEARPRSPHLDAFGLDRDGQSWRGRGFVRDVDMHCRDCPRPGRDAAVSSCTQVHSMSPTMKPVANTSGISRNSGDLGIEMRHGLALGHGVGRSDALGPALRDGFMASHPYRCTRSRRLAGLLVAGDGGIHALPGAQEIEAAVFLHQLHRLIDHALQLVVVAELDKAGEREVLAQRVTLEAVVGEDAPQVRVAGERMP